MFSKGSWAPSILLGMGYQGMNSMRHGVTMVETIVVVTIIGVLLGVLLPTLHGARRSARQAVSKSNLRSHLTVFNTYAEEYTEYYPYFTSPDGMVELDYHGLAIPTLYFGAHFRWQIALADEYYGGIAPHPSQLAPQTSHICSYYYSAAFLADPRFWAGETRQGPEQWRAVRRFEVTYPASKALFTEVVQTIPWARATGVRDVGLGMVDGSVRYEGTEGLIEPYLDGEGSWEGVTFHHGVYGMHTVSGVRGRDVAH